MRLPTRFWLVLAVTLSACGGNDALMSKLADSEATWQRARDAHGNSYTYTHVRSSFSGPLKRTTLTVEQGAVVSRAFVLFERDPQTGIPAVTDTWNEQGAEIGSHAEGAPALTLDAYYRQCRDEILAHVPAQSHGQVILDGNGFLIACGTVRDDNCADGCGEGFSLDAITLL
jgi:hypothetical protein